MNSMYLKAGMKPQSPPEKSKRKKKTQNTFIQLSFDLCISPLPHLQWLQWGQCVNVVIKLCSMDIRNLPEPMH